MVVLAHSAVLRVREKTTLRAAFMMPVKRWSAVGKATAMAWYETRPMMCAYAL